MTRSGSLQGVLKRWRGGRSASALQRGDRRAYLVGEFRPPKRQHVLAAVVEALAVNDQVGARGLRGVGCVLFWRPVRVRGSVVFLGVPSSTGASR